MSKYTTEIRYICETYAGKFESEGYSSIEDIIRIARPMLFNFDYPIFDPSYKPVLETKIIKHYYTREISEETLGLWKLRLNTKLNEIMPYYNRLYEATACLIGEEFNPFDTIDIRTTRDTDRAEAGTGKTTETVKSDTSNTTNSTGTEKRTSNTQNSSEGTSTTEDTRETIDTIKTDTQENGKKTEEQEEQLVKDTKETTTDHSSKDSNSTNYKLYSDTPQGSLSGVDTEQYLTNATKTTDESNEKDIGYSNTITDSADISNINNIATTENTQEQNTTDTKNDTGVSVTKANSSGTETGTNTGDVQSQTHFNSNTTGNREQDKTNNVDTTIKYVERIKGRSNDKLSYQLLSEMAESLINIDTMIIESLSPLFFGLWD